MLLRKQIPISYVFSLVKFRITIVAIIAGSISYFDQYFKDWGILFPIIPEWFPGLLGTSITLILAFRTNQSYDRWWESRKLWGAIVNDVRGLLREVKYLKTIDVDPEKHELFRLNMSDATVLWLHVLKDSLRKKSLDPHRFALNKLKINVRSNVPNAILDRMQEFVVEAYENGIINDFHMIKMTQSINALGASMGGCERIKNTVFPQLYSNTIDFAIWIFVVVFPLAFRDPNEYVEFPVVMLVSMIFMMLEKVAIQIQDPFQNRPTDVPISSIARAIEIHGLRVLGNEDKLEPYPAGGFYLM